MKKALIAVIILLALSIAGNVILITMKGITVNNTYNQQQYQNQQQAQIMVSMFMNKGSFEWKVYTAQDIDKMNIKNVNQFLNTLDPYQSMFAKIIGYGTVLVPVLKEKK